MRSPRPAVLCLAALILFSTAAVAHAQIPGDFVGMYSEDAFFGSPGYRADALTTQADAGVGIERIPFDWRQIETAPGNYDFGPYDAFVGAAAAAGLEVLPVVGDAPVFRSDAPADYTGSAWYPPLDPADMAQFVSVLVGRYGPEGSFWTANPGLERIPIENWQVWNEPNLPVFWGWAPDAAAYARLLRLAADAIHAADPAATVVSAGLPESGAGIPLGEYVDELYAAGFKGSFDAFGLHGYAPGAYGTLDLVAYTRELLHEHGDDTPIWLTEFGFSTGGSSAWYTVSETEQAARIAQTLAALWQRRNELRLRGAVLFKWRDAVPGPGQADAWPLYAGLLRADGSAKPALAAFRDTVAAMTPAPSAQPADPAAPSAGFEPSDPVSAGAPVAAASRGLRVRWVELSGRRARIHATCERGAGPCSGRLVITTGRGARGARRYRVAPARRTVLSVRLSARMPRGARWVRVALLESEKTTAQRLLARHLRR